MSRLAPLSEEPSNEENNSSRSRKGQSWRNWFKNHFNPLSKKSDLKILLSVLGCPLFPLSVNPKEPLSQVSHVVSHIYIYTLLLRKQVGIWDMQRVTRYIDNCVRGDLIGRFIGPIHNSALHCGYVL